jgi:hypothetical protein
VKRSEADAEYAFYTGKASDLVRQLALGGFAVIWLFKTDTTSGPTVPEDFRVTAVFLLASLAADFAQYAVSAPLWHWFKRKLELDGLKPDDTFTAPDWLYYAPDALFYVKLVALALAYACLIFALLGNAHVFRTPASAQAAKPTVPGTPVQISPAASPRP